MTKGQVRKKIFLSTILFVGIGFVLLKSILQTSTELYEKQKQKKEYTKILSELKEKEEELNNTVTKLQDPDYVARYAREKYLYSKDGEIIIRVPD